jgi:hypothetical protein
MATKYLQDTYQAGKGHGWEGVRSSSGSYPLDGIGYHLYVRESAGNSPADIQRTHKKYLDAVSGVIRQQDVAEKKIYISEFGWSSASGEGYQAQSLKAGFDFLLNDSRVALAIYFCTQDFPGKEYGLYRPDKSKKPAYNAFVEQALLEREALGVAVTAVAKPTLGEKMIAKLDEQLVAFRTIIGQLQQEVQGLRQQAAASQGTLVQLRKQVDTLRQHLVSISTTTPVPTSPVTPPAAGPPPMEDVITSLRRHPTKRFDKRTLDQIKYLVIQHSVLPGDFPPEKIANFLVEKKQWPGIGYHFYITSDGKIYQTNLLETVCYFAGSNVQYNPQGVCICFAGNFMEAVPTSAQLKSGGKLLAFLMQELHLPIGSIKGQKEFVITQSPGDQWDSGQKWKDMLLAEVKAAQT